MPNLHLPGTWNLLSCPSLLTHPGSWAGFSEVSGRQSTFICKPTIFSNITKQANFHIRDYNAIALPVLVIHLELSKRNTGFKTELGKGKRSSFHCTLVLWWLWRTHLKHNINEQGFLVMTQILSSTCIKICFGKWKMGKRNRKVLGLPN